MMEHIDNNQDTNEVNNIPADNNVEEVNYYEQSDEEFEKQFQEQSESSNESNVDNEAEYSEAEQHDNTLNLQEFYDTITAPIRANGKEIQVTNVEDLRRLVQMGTNYNAKMEKLKSSFNIVKTLEQQNIDREKLQFLIDLANHDKAAIAKLISDAQYDTYDSPDLETTPYQPKNYIIPDDVIEFQEVVDEIISRPQGIDLIRELSGWDNTSAEFLKNSPEAIETLYEHKTSGLYAETLATIERDKLLGKIPKEVLKKPFIELYSTVSSQLEEHKKLAQQSANKIVGNNIQRNPVRHQMSPAPKSAGVKTSGTTQRNFAEVPNFVDMSDEDFEIFTKTNRNLNF